MKANVFYLSASASVAEGLRPKLLAKGLGHIFGKIFRCNGQIVLTLILFYKERSILATPWQISYFWGRSLGVP